MKNKIGIVITSLLFIISSAAAATGYVYSKEGNVDKTNTDNNKDTITYEYYLDDVKQTNMPQKEELLDEFGNPTGKNKYLFSRFNCTNNVSGSFDEENWNFNPENEKESTCSLYFVNSQYTVTVDARGGIVTSSNPNIVDRGSDIEFNITPDEGYEFTGTEVTCSNNKTATWDQSTNTLSVSSVTEDMACTISFTIKELRVDITVKNGTGNTTENTSYGGNISAIVEPNSGYENPTVTCTNKQEAKFENNKLIIDKLTDNTACTISFSKVEPKNYNVKLTDIPEEVTVTTAKEFTIVSGGTVTFTLKANDGFVVSGISCTPQVVPETTNNADGTVSYKFLSVTQDIDCKITASAKITDPTPTDTSSEQEQQEQTQN